MVTERQLTETGQEIYSELCTMSEREILAANNLRLRYIEREVRSTKMLLIGLLIAGFSFVAAVELLNVVG